MRETRREFVKSAGGALVGGAMVTVGATLAAPSKETAPRQGAGAPRPNILFFYPDQLRYDWVGKGSGGAAPVPTPNLDRLSGEGARFTRAFTPAPVCAAARACLASGKEYDKSRCPGNSFNYPLDQTTVYRMLRDAGYHVMGCGKFDLAKADHKFDVNGQRLVHEWGFSDGIDNEGKSDALRSFRSGGPGPYWKYLNDKRLFEVHQKDFRSRNVLSSFPTPLSDEDYCDNWIARNGLTLLGRAPKDKPWFLQVNFNGPHPPWDITASMEKECRQWRNLPPPCANEKGASEEYLKVRQNYAAMIHNIDRWLGVYVEELRRRGQIDNTLIVFSSDHGEMLGDRDEWGKGRPWQPSAGVPLVIWGPGVRKGVVCDAPSETLDVTATFLDYAGLQPLADMNSRSLRPFLEGRAGPPRQYALSGLSTWRMVYDGRYKLARNWQKEDWLVDLKTDPRELANLIKTETGIAARLNAILDKEGAGEGYKGKEWSRHRRATRSEEGEEE